MMKTMKFLRDAAKMASVFGDESQWMGPSEFRLRVVDVGGLRSGCFGRMLVPADLLGIVCPSVLVLRGRLRGRGA